MFVDLTKSLESLVKSKHVDQIYERVYALSTIEKNAIDEAKLAQRF